MKAADGLPHLSSSFPNQELGVFVPEFDELAVAQTVVQHLEKHLHITLIAAKCSVNPE